MYSFYLSPTTLDEVLALKAQHGEAARIIAGGTDLLIELQRGGRRVESAEDGSLVAPGVIDLTRVPGLADIAESDGWLHLGPLVTHNQCVASPRVVEHAFALARACWEVGAPQIRNRATIAGNIITASPANDSIVPLLALGATVTVASQARGERTLSLGDFLVDFRQVDLAADEILVRVSIPVRENQRGTFIKLGLRRAQAISVVSAAVVGQFSGEGESTRVDKIAISLGAVAATVVRVPAAEDFLVGKSLTDDVIDEAARLATGSVSPIDDVRGSATYRSGMVEALVGRALRQLRDGRERAGWREQPVMLWGENGGEVADSERIVNGEWRRVNGEWGRSRLGGGGDAAGCAANGGLCRRKVGVRGGGVWVVYGLFGWDGGDGVHGAGGAGAGQQNHHGGGAGSKFGEWRGDARGCRRALVQSGGVQCGYCTPGFVMSAAKLLEERPQPTRAEAQEALTGNLCRCTGYRKIIDAVMAAGAGG